MLFLELGADTMNFELRCWLRDVNFSLSVRSDMNFEIIERFGKEGIRTQFYGRDLPPDRARRAAGGQPAAGARRKSDGRLDFPGGLRDIRGSRRPKGRAGLVL